MMACTIGDAIGAAIFGALFAPVVGVAEWLRRRERCGPESSRKLVHVGGGLLSLALPWLVRSFWVVLAMSLALAAVFALARRASALRSLHGVARRTSGTEYFPLAVCAVYLVAYGQYWLYASAILVLAVADACAALIGTRYGSIRYEVDGDSKSVEGSAFFLIVAFLAMHLPMLLLSDLPREVCVLSALLVAVLVTGFEAVSLKGADNLFIPLGVSVILSKITTKPVPEILYQTASLAVLSLAVLLAMRRSRPFNAGGAIMFTLFAYGAWSLGSERWALPILTGFAVYAAAWWRFPLPAERRPAVRLLFRALVVPLLLLVGGNMLGREAAFFLPFVAAVGAVLALSLMNHAALAWPEAGAPMGWTFAAGAGLVAWVAVALPALALVPGGTAADGAALLAVLVAAGLVNRVCMPPRLEPGADALWPAHKLAITVAAALAAWGLTGGGVG